MDPIPDLLTTIDRIEGATVLVVGGPIREGDPGRLVERIGSEADSDVLVVDLSAAHDLRGAATEELLWRLGRLPCQHSVALVHTDLDARRHLRRGTALPVLPSLDVARSSLLPVGVPAAPGGRSTPGPHTSGRRA